MGNGVRAAIRARPNRADIANHDASPLTKACPLDEALKTDINRFTAMHFNIRRKKNGHHALTVLNKEKQEAENVAAI